MIGNLTQALSITGLSILIVASPWAFGGIAGSTQKWLFIVALATLLPSCLIQMAMRTRPNAIRVPLVCFGLLIALLVGLLQVTPFQHSLLKSLTPHAFKAVQTSTAAAGETLPAKLPISLYPASTRNDLALLGLIAIVFVAASSMLRSRTAQIAVLGIAAINGTAFALFGLVQQLTFNGKLYWTVPLRFGGRPFAAFVNRNHAGGYLNMCTAAALALSIYVLTRRNYAYGGGPDDFAQPYARGGSLRGGISGLLANLDSWGLLSLSLAGFATVGTVCSVSRGAILALICAAVFTAYVAARSRGTITVAAGAVAALTICIAVAVWVGQSGSMQELWGDTVNDFHDSNSRIDHWQDVTAVCQDYWPTGTGLGTYRFAYRPYESQVGGGWFFHAENQYLEAAVEMGWIGLLLMVVMILIVVRAATNLMHSPDDSLSFAIGLAGTFTICSQAVHSGLDFGMYMPANAILCATICGFAVARIPSYDGSETQWTVPASPVRTILESILLLSMAGWLAWGATQTFKKAEIETATDLAISLATNHECDPDQIADAIRSFETATEEMSDDAMAQFRLAELHVLKYRSAAFSELRKTLSSNDELLWELTLPASLHRRAYDLRGSDGLKNLKEQSLVQQYLVPAVRHLQMARKSCPLMPKTHLLMAELFWLLPAADEKELDEAELVRTAVQLAPNNPDILFRAGLLDWQAGRDATAKAEWRKSLTISPKHAATIFRVVISAKLDATVDPVATIADIAPAEPAKIIAVGQQLSDPTYRRLLAEKAEEALPLAASTPGTRVHLQAAALELKGRLAEAVTLYEQACSENPNNVVWKYQLAQLLMENGQYEAAAKYAASCVKLAPRIDRYRHLLRRIRVKIGESAASKSKAK